MRRRADFAYVQARLQARHGMRPDAVTWHHLAAIGGLSGYLHNARHTPLRPWLLALGPGAQSHEIELRLRREFRMYVRAVAHWHPQGWRPAVRWAACVIDLPVLQHLLAGQAAPRWVLDDPELKGFASATPAARLAELGRSEHAPLVRAWQAGTPLPEGWLAHWRQLWPSLSKSAAAGLEGLARLFQRQRSSLGASASNDSTPLRAALEQGLTRAFRRSTQQPAATFAHLALTVLDLERLRADLLRRQLFDRNPEPTP